MSTKVELADCMTHALKQLFPTLEWDRVTFYLGLPWPYSLGSQGAITLPSGISSIHIYFRPEDFAPCTRDFFVLCAHELVHALQIQESFFGGKGLSQVNGFSFKYMTCYFSEWSAEEGNDNRYEDEAYEYEDLLERALDSVPADQQADQQLPCLCDAIPFGSANPNFIGVHALAKVEPGVIKRNAEASGFCKARLMSFGVGSGDSADTANIVGWAALGAAVGAFIGGIIGGPGGAFAGFVVGALIGAAIGVLDYLTGIPSAIVIFVGLIVVSIVTAVKDFVGAIVDLIAPGDRELRVMFSTDDGLTFGNPVTVGSTGEQPALTFSPDYMFIGWTSSDNKLNVMRAPDPYLKQWEWASDDSGPALAWGDHLYLIWQRRKNRLLSRTSANGRSFTGRKRIDAKAPDDATPGVTYGNGRAYVAWIRKNKNNRIGIKSSGTQGAHWGSEKTLHFRSRDEGTAAIAFGNDRLFLAWARKKRQYLHIATLSVSNRGRPSLIHDLDLDVRCKKDTGPALAFGNNRLFIAWVGRNEQRLNVRPFDVSANGNLTARSDVQLPQRAKKNAGPALAYGNNVLALAWPRKNR